jgi:hypothetical protein
VTQAKELAIQATETGVPRGEPMQTASETWRLVCVRLDQQPKEEFISARGGRATRVLNAALPGKHTKLLRDNLSSSQAAITTQQRTGYIRLNNYLQKVCHVDKNRCGYGGDNDDDGETVQHFLFHYPKWEQLRQEMKDMMASRYGALSYALGGRSPAVLSNGEPVDSIGSWRPNLKVKQAVLRYVTNTGRLEGEIGR